MLKQLFFSFVIGLIPLVLFYLSGKDIFVRSPETALWIFISIIAFIGTYATIGILEDLT